MVQGCWSIALIFAQLIIMVLSCPVLLIIIKVKHACGSSQLTQQTIHELVCLKTAMYYLRPGSQCLICLHRVVTGSRCKRMLQCNNRKKIFLFCNAMCIQINLYVLGGCNATQAKYCEPGLKLVQRCTFL